MKKALILVDLQNDFMPGGALAVDKADEVIPVANRVQQQFKYVIATQDWHPEDHICFAKNHHGHFPGEFIHQAGLSQMLWPVHCVQNTKGAEFVKNLKLDHIIKVVRKGSNPNVDSYSGFFENDHQKATGLAEFLKKLQITELYIMGVATDYCVKYTVLDSCKLGFKTYLIEDGCRAVNVNPEDGRLAISEMKAVGVKIIQSDSIF
ncbi:bifunctional nicotinamidase/pyrazinamidase [Rickettsiella grylli]|uniref:Nicotinamidase n=1 Tax=Rickettsiella grylli TaxID=59196 RepID=A8PM04_9COXI|nr:bifunctional nicotinamidase/pyrazinamidase [Rickettsiella grylli]EDP45777.1 pyrazinamidase/nicotinamidase (PZAase)(Nicotine deamidase) (NAMase) [Rickettsiella grylli]OIZ99625.1 nicotinamidase [Rickettsiella grylli]